MFPGRRKLLAGWCGCLSEHPLPLLLWVCELYGWFKFPEWNQRMHFWCLDLLFPHFGRLCEKKYANLAAYYNCHKERPSIKATARSACPKNPQSDGVLTGIWDDDTAMQCSAIQSGLSCTLNKTNKPWLFCLQYWPSPLHVCFHEACWTDLKQYQLDVSRYLTPNLKQHCDAVCSRVLAFVHCVVWCRRSAGALISSVKIYFIVT